VGHFSYFFFFFPRRRQTCFSFSDVRPDFVFLFCSFFSFRCSLIRFFLFFLLRRALWFFFFSGADNRFVGQVFCLVLWFLCAQNDRSTNSFRTDGDGPLPDHLSCICFPFTLDAGTRLCKFLSVYPFLIFFFLLRSPPTFWSVRVVFYFF